MVQYFGQFSLISPKYYFFPNFSTHFTPFVMIFQVWFPLIMCKVVSNKLRDSAVSEMNVLNSSHMSWYGTESYYCRIIICVHVCTKHYKSSLKRNIVKLTSWNIAVVVLDQGCIWTVCSMASTEELNAWMFSSGSRRDISWKLSSSSMPLNKTHHRNIFGCKPL